MTRDDLLSEQFGHGTADERPRWLRPWTAAEQAHHRLELLAVVAAHQAARRKPRPAAEHTRPPWRARPTREVVDAVVGDLPPRALP